MEAAAGGGRDAGGHTIGVTCALWPLKANRWIVEEIPTRSYVERIMTLLERGNAYVVLPGGTGTLAELSLAWEIMNKASLSGTLGGRKPLLVLGPYWKPVIECLKKEAGLASRGSNLSSQAMDVLTLVTDAEEAAEKLKAWLKGVPQK